MKDKTLVKEYFFTAVGSIIFALGVNLFIVPQGIYNGGIVGTAQLLRTVLVEYLHVEMNFDIAGIINMCLNIPMLIMAYFKLNPSFVKKTAFSLIIQTFAFSLIPIMSNPIIDDRLTSVVVGSIVAGYGVGMILIQKATAGGLDMATMLMFDKHPTISVGKINLYYNVMVYIICALMFDLEIAIYSVLHAIIFSGVVDRRHLQNIEVSLLVFTRNKDVKNMIIHDLHRGVTYWKGQGAYTNQETEVLVTIASKYEVALMRQRIKAMDPKAFIIVTDHLTGVDGNVEKRLV